MDLLLALHNHQPVGNLPAVFARAYEECYEPLLAAIERHPGVRLAMHHSGSLLDWLQSERPGYLDRLLALRARGQVEILGGGYYEPLLPVVPVRDARGQIELMARFWEERTGQRPSGLWLTERIWDPFLPALLAGTGIRYTLVDDTHLRYAGLRREVFGGYYMTERGGHGLALLPIDKGLRYRIPFAPADEVVEHLVRLAAGGLEAVTYGDDGEKFGLWPGTHQWVFARGWLEAFLAGLERATPAVVTTLPGEYVARAVPAGCCYLPTAAYEEMLEWALPTDSQREYRELRHRLRDLGLEEAVGPFLRGGLWENFLVKYPESNQLHKRMLRVSRRLAASEEGAAGTRPGARATLAAARRALYRGQCSCVYWHGLFGGLYLGHLRDATYAHLLAADHLLDELDQQPGGVRAERTDYDLDGHEEAVLESTTLSAFVAPARGGALVELDDKPRALNPLETLARREEAYHGVTAKGGGEGGTQGERPRSIHEGERCIPGDLARALVRDRGPRHAFLDHLWGSGTTFEGLLKGEAEELVSPWRPYALRRVDCVGDQATAELVWEGSAGGLPLRLAKCYRLASGGASLVVDYTLECRGEEAGEVWLAVEVNFTLLGAAAPSYHYELLGPSGPIAAAEPGLGSTGTAEGVCEVRAHDEVRSVVLRLGTSEPLACWRFPVETVSQSESGFELTYQGSAVLLHRRGRAEPGRPWKLRFELEVTGG